MSEKPEAEIIPSEPDTLHPSASVVLARDILPDRLPIIPINNRPVFPKMIVPMILDEEPIKAMLANILKSQARHIGLLLRKPSSEKNDQTTMLPEDLFTVGVVAEVLKTHQPAPDAPIQLMLGIVERFRVETFLAQTPPLLAHVKILYETDMAANEELKAFSVAIINNIKELTKLNPLFKEELSIFLTRANLNEPGRLADFSSAMTTASPTELQDILETISIRARMEKALVLLKKELDVSRLQTKINQQIEEKLSRQQRNFFLREQLKAIKKELGLAKEGKEAELERFAERIKSLKLPTEAAERIQEEMDKLSLLDAASPEFNVSRNYLDWLTALPWGIVTADRFNLSTARRVLDRDHYGLDDVKERILEFISVGILKGSVSGSILCLVGPPGVGKTSIGQSIAESLGRKFYRFSLGGMRDEAEIKGHRRTYIGAMPGKFLQALKTCKSANPLIMLDEVDKIGASFHGDPASALLEVLDPAQNKDFLDHYLDVRFDLSNVLFVCTANITDTIPRPLLDRMEIIKLSGYILLEKLKIAERYLIPKQTAIAGLKPSRLRITRSALNEIIDGYAREPGVRSLENCIKKICRKTARRVVEKPKTKVLLNPQQVNDFLGKRVFPRQDPYTRPRIGVVAGLAWTGMGGEMLYIEATNVPSDKPGMKQTGQLGAIMVESTEIAYTFVRNFLKDNQKANDFFAKNFIHLHIPAGATPKDGPSAGITMATALYSLALGKPVRRGFAMTGELTLTGLIMPIGGIKEKTIAARRAKIRNVILPSENQEDFEELPQHVRNGITPHFVSTFSELLQACFAPCKTQKSVSPSPNKAKTQQVIKQS